jgi:hypothetical protein
MSAITPEDYEKDAIWYLGSRDSGVMIFWCPVEKKSYVREYSPEGKRVIFTGTKGECLAHVIINDLRKPSGLPWNE